jgi:hypothetical protein
VPKRGLVGKEHKVYILDFFGSPALRGNSFHVAPKHFLTAYGSPWNTFLGYCIEEINDQKNTSVRLKKQQGIIWGKDSKYLMDHVDTLRKVADSVPLYSTCSSVPFKHDNIHFIGHQSSAQWLDLLIQSKFLIGLGDPLLGPSAIDAVSAGAVYINPIYKEAKKEIFKEQHPFASKYVGAPYVCSYHESNVDELRQCVSSALSANLMPLVPKELSCDVYLTRVKDIFNL